MSRQREGGLVLTRRAGERILLGAGDTQIIIEVIRIENKQVKIWFKAPPYIKIDREEVLAEKVAASE